MLLTQTQHDTLRYLLDTIIPPDDYPGAWEAGVGDYLLRQLEGDLAPQLPAYRAGLDALEAESLAVYDLPFAQLDAQQQTQLLTQIGAGGTRTHWPVPPARFLQMAVNHAAEGYYSDPGNGGNRNAVSWRMIGFEVTA